MYDPKIGRWTTQDPLGFAAGDVNLYRYVDNGPTNAADPNGLQQRVGEQAIEREMRRGIRASAPVNLPESEQQREIDQNRLAYYANGGWIDWAHANGAYPKMLLREIAAESENDEQRGHYELGTCRVLKEEGVFKIHIKAGGSFLEELFYPVEGYAIKKGLTKAQGDSVALAIIMDYSKRFEEWQGTWFPRQFSNSSFSQEDLPSDLIGFYMALNDWNRVKIEDLIGPQLGKPDAKSLLRSLGNDLGNPDNKNRSFDPVDHNPQVFRMTGDPGFAKPLTWPAQLKTVTPAPEGILWERVGAYVPPPLS